jgi:hypothetical protein
MVCFHLNDLIFHTISMRMQHKQKKLPSQRFELRRWLSRKFTASFSNIDWGDDSSCEDVTPQTGGEEAGRNTIGSGSSDGTKFQRRLIAVFDSFTGSVINGIFAHRDEKSTKNGHESSTDMPTAAKHKHRRKQPLLQQRKSSSSTTTPAAAELVHLPTSPLDESEVSVDDDGFLHWNKHRKQSLQPQKKSAAAAAALIHPPTSSPLDESEISVDDDGFLHWNRTKGTFTQCPMINESVTK